MFFKINLKLKKKIIQIKEEEGLSKYLPTKARVKIFLKYSIKPFACKERIKNVLK